MTSPSEDALALDRTLENLIDRFRRDHTSGAGQRATAIHGLEIVRFDARLGVPLYPDEPVSQVIAALGQDYTYKRLTLHLWQPENHPWADIRVEQLGDELEVIRDYMEELLPREIPGTYTGINTVDQLEQRLTAAAVPTGRVDYAALKDRIDIVEYIQRYVPLRRMGARWKGKCPFHQEKTASFVVYTDTKSYYCFGCGVHGDVIDFAKAISNTLPAVA